MQEYYRGQYESSDRTEKRAKKWVICSIVTGVVFVVGIIFFSIAIQGIAYAVAYSNNGDYERYDWGRQLLLIS